jgi:hypothetical protein
VHSLTRRVSFLLVYETLTTKDPEVGDIELLPNKELIWGLLKKSMKIDPICCITRRIDSFRPKSLRCVIIIYHCSCESNQGLVLAFNNSILLRGVGGGEFMLDILFVTPIFNVHILELGVIVTLNLHNLRVVFSLSSSCKSLISGVSLLSPTNKVQV